MTAAEMLALFDREDRRLFALWRLPSFPGWKRLAGGTRQGGWDAGFPQDEKGETASADSRPAVTLAQGERLRRALGREAFGRLAGTAGLFQAGSGVLAEKGAAFFGDEAGEGVRQLFRAPRDFDGPAAAGASWRRASGGAPAPLAGSAGASGQGRRLRQAAAGRETLLAQSMALLQRQEGEEMDFDGLLARLERRLAIELGAG